MKIVGNGLLANAFLSQDYKDVTIFASGVSNSLETNKAKFLRESDLLQEILELNGQLIYFSTASIYSENSIKTAYVQHKLKMEEVVLEKSSHNIVIRLPQVVGESSNPHTLVNFLANSIVFNRHYYLQSSAVKNLIDIEHVVELTSILIHKNCSGGLYNFCVPVSCKVGEIVNTLELLLEKKSNHSIVDGNIDHFPASSFVTKCIQDGVVSIPNSYVNKILRKYYSCFRGF